VVNQLNALTSALTITIGGAPATITYQGLAPGYVGLYQFNVTVPNIPANNNAPVALMVNGSPVPQKLVVAIGN
jgi:adhesin/invasin